MSNSLLSTISIILSEVVILLIGVIVFLIIKNRKKILPTSQGDTSSKNNIKETILCLEKLEKITASRLNSLDTNNNNSESYALTKRLDFIRSEISILKSHDLNTDNTNYWNMVDKTYHKNDEEHNSDANLSNKEAIYQARINNLENFKIMFYDAEKRIIKSNITINELRNLVEAKPSPDISALIEKINEIENENMILSEKIQHADNELAKRISDISNKEDSSELDGLKEENEFLVEQIQHLLQNEVYASKKMLENINSLEDALSEKNEECKQLTDQLAKKS